MHQNTFIVCVPCKDQKLAVQRLLQTNSMSAKQHHSENVESSMRSLLMLHSKTVYRT